MQPTHKMLTLKGPRAQTTRPTARVLINGLAESNIKHFLTFNKVVKIKLKSPWLSHFIIMPNLWEENRFSAVAMEIL